MKDTDYEERCPCGRRWLIVHHADGSFDIASKAGTTMEARLALAEDGGLVGGEIPMYPLVGAAKCERRWCRWLGRTKEKSYPAPDLEDPNRLQ